jgi:hypothetical protein
VRARAREEESKEGKQRIFCSRNTHTRMASMLSAASPRRVYLDMGTNWGDTLDLYKQGLADPEHGSATNWEVFGFEAAPLLMPYLDQLVQWKNGVVGITHPVTCEPPVGSTHDKIRFSAPVGCYRSWAAKVNFCMADAFKDAFLHVRPDMTLINRSTVDQRLELALHAPRPGAINGARYVFVPAAVGGRYGTIQFSKTRGRAHAGADLDANSARHMASGSGDAHYVPVQIVGAWK